MAERTGRFSAFWCIRTVKLDSFRHRLNFQSAYCRKLPIREVLFRLPLHLPTTVLMSSQGEYKYLPVVERSLCPNHSWICFNGTPFASTGEVQLCRKLWKHIRLSKCWLKRRLSTLQNLRRIFGRFTLWARATQELHNIFKSQRKTVTKIWSVTFCEFVLHTVCGERVGVVFGWKEFVCF